MTETDKNELRNKFRKLLDEAEKIDDAIGKSLDKKSFVWQNKIGRHPTGVPEKTGGWYGDDLLDSSEDAEVTSVGLGSAPTKLDKTPSNELQDANIYDAPTEIDESDLTPPPLLGNTPQINTPAVDTRGMPLPRNVTEIDIGATEVTRTALNKKVARGGALSKNVIPSDSKTKTTITDSLGCLFRMTLIGLFVLVIFLICASTLALYEYYSIASELPDIQNLRLNASQFETTRIYDRQGNLLYEILDPNAGRRTYVPLEEISPYLVAATIATEDKDFYNNPGFDPLGIIRALIQNISSGETVSGASTITQQLTRTLLFTPEERSQRTYIRKIREAILAAEITRRYTKDEILELYLNEIYYGNLAYGVEAAAQTYFRTSAKNLTLAQAAFLAGLPQLPAVYDVYSNRDVALKRQQDVLLLMYQASQEQSCIYVSNNPQPICVDAGEAALAAKELLDYEFPEPDIDIKYPHWVNYIRQRLEELYDPQTIYRSGFSVYTTLDPGLQDISEKTLRNHLNQLTEQHVTNGALVIIKPSTGEILGMVGSADYFNEDISGQINMALSPRQPGSAIKPLTYLAAFEKGWTPATLIWDVPTEFPPSGDPNDPRPPYKPVNYDGQYHGPVTVRYALANSYNVPAVKALQFVGIYDDPSSPEPDGLIELARRLGITTFNRNDYGLSLTLGGGEVTLLAMTKAYAVLANGGVDVQPYAISYIKNKDGEIVYEHQGPQPTQIVRAEHAYLISSILSDNIARTPAFGPNSVLNLPFPAAVKTGTTNDFRDNWTVGYTPDVAIGVWVGNADYTPMINTSGLTGAAPIWADVMTFAIQQLTGNNPTPFARPAGIVEKIICSVSGTEPSKWCTEQRLEYFAFDQLPLPKEYDLWQEVLIDTWTNKLASPECNEFIDETLVLQVNDPWARKWLVESEDGRKWAETLGFDEKIVFKPNDECSADDPRPIIDVTNPSDGALIDSSPIIFTGRIGATAGFKGFRIDYGIGESPSVWNKVITEDEQIESNQAFYEWDISEIPSGIVTIRIRVEGSNAVYADKYIKIDLQVPTPTPTPTHTASPTPTVTATPTPTSTPSPTSTPTRTTTPTVTPIIIHTNTPSP